MRWINRAIVMAMVLTFSAVTAWAQAKECTDEFKQATYSKWYDNRQNNQDVAYEAAKEYVAVCPTDDSPYAQAVKKFIEKYDALKATQNTAAQFEAAVKAKNYADQVRLGKQLVAMPSNADNAVIYIVIAGAGLGDPNLLSESAQAAKKAIELVEAGKPFTPAYQTKDQALAAMNYVLAKATMKTSATDAIPYFIKAAKYESDLKKSPIIYNELATAYGEGPVAKFAKDYQALAAAGTSVESPETKLVVANLNQALDRQIDAFARAAAVSTTPADKKAFMDVLAAVYKDRNKKDAAENELNNLVASALTRPIPDPPAPITTLPTPAGAGATPAGSPPAGAPASGATPGNSGSSTTNPSSSPPSTTTKPVPSSTPTTTPAKPTASPTASPTPKPKLRRANHRRG